MRNPVTTTLGVLLLLSIFIVTFAGLTLEIVCSEATFETASADTRYFCDLEQERRP